MRRILVAASVLAFGLTLAQDVGIPPNLADWFASQAALAAVVAALVALVRKHVWKSLDGPAVVGTSVALGVVLAYLGHRLGYLGSDWFTFGMVAGLLASGGVDAIRGALREGSGGAPGGTGDAPSDVDRARLR
jgi:small basic protein